MLNRRVKVILVSLALSLAVSAFTSGCGALGKDDVVETETETQTETETETESETETETEIETELQKDIAYTSQDKTIRIMLPDSTWKVKQDVDEMRVFSSGSDAMISIVHAADDAAMKNITVYESEDALKAGMAKQYQEANSFEVLEFEKMSTATLDTYEYVVKYNATSMWAYSITYSILAEDEAYVISGTVTDDNRVLMEAVKNAVESFTVLRNAAFNSIAGTVVELDESESETEEQGAKGELNSLVDYGTSATLYVSADIVNIRREPSTDSEIIGSFGEGDAVTVVGETAQWFKINILGNIGYVSKAFLVSTAPDTQTEETNAAGSNSQDVSDDTMVSAEMNSYVDYGTSYTYYTTAAVNLRAQPGTGSGILGGVNSGAAVSVIGETSNWFVVSVNGATGYIAKSYLSATDTSGDAGSSDSSGDSSGSSENSGPTSGTGTLSGTIQSVTTDTMVILGDDGNLYTLNYGDASVASADGVYEGIYIVAAVDYSKSSGGTYYATVVNGY